jgi:hypothetical protein
VEESGSRRAARSWACPASDWEDRVIAVRLVRLIEDHSDDLADGLLRKFQTSPRTKDLRKIPARELRNRSYEILRHLSEWLLSKPNSDIQRRYLEIGALRACQEVSLADLCWAIVLTKEHIGDFLERQGLLQGPVDIYGEMELLRLLDQFFDRAICYSVEGYENAKSENLNYLSSLNRSRPPKAARPAEFPVHERSPL